MQSIDIYSLVYSEEKVQTKANFSHSDKYAALLFPMLQGQPTVLLWAGISNFFLEKDLDGLHVDFSQLGLSRQYTPGSCNLVSTTHGRKAWMCSSKSSESEGSIYPPRKHGAR